ncbi:MAG: hypothetical protein J3K34DRAFT_518916 [Monoraphidium minutum]|nr:MAG: hypothetical protein J3K34DRAFT_518916 [Monoraphidium minutum]
MARLVLLLAALAALSGLAAPVEGAWFADARAGAEDALAGFAGSIVRPWWARAPNPPVFPSSFEAEYTFSLPYVKVVQTQGLSYPVHLWYDGEGGRLRVDVYGGLDSTIQTDPDTVYSLYPRINTTACDVAHSAAGPTTGGGGAALGARLLADAPLPDVSAWAYAGVTTLNGKTAHIWTLRERHGEKTNVYSFYAAEDGSPLRLYMMGTNVIAYSHYDEYLVDFKSWKPGKPSDKAFAVPKACDTARKHHAAAAAAPGSPRAARVMQAAALMPWARLPGGGSGGGAASGGGVGGPVLRRLAARAEAARSWLPEEYSALMTARRPTASDARLKSRALGVFTADGLSRDGLPRHVDWRGTGADIIIKDQATCGSCWAFATTGTMEGAWYAATGESISLSEQQLVDCSWDYGNNGCGGGNMEPAIQYVTDAGGALGEEAYQYLGQNALCGLNATARAAPPSARFLGFAQVAPRDEVALMAAVARLGPVAVSIDASQLDFKFYSGGVYANRKCKSGRDDLDHAVLVVGYGTTDEGEDYWLIRNSWSSMWGSNGYIRMKRTGGDGNDCGVMTDPVVAIPHPAAASAAARRLGRAPAPAPKLAPGADAAAAAGPGAPPARDGGASASTSGSGHGPAAADAGVDTAASVAPRLRIRMRPPGPQDWLMLLDDAPLPRGLGKPGRRSQQEAADEADIGGGGGGGAEGDGSSGGAGDVLAAAAAAPFAAAGSCAELLSLVEAAAGSPQGLAPGDVAAALRAAVRLSEAADAAPRRGRRQQQQGAQQQGAQQKQQQQQQQEDDEEEADAGTPTGGEGREAERCALRRACRLLLARFFALGADAFAAADLAGIMQSCAKLQRAAAGDWRGAALAAAGALGPSLPVASMGELTRIIWSLAKLRAPPPPAWLDAFCRASQSHFPTAAPRELTSSAWALARLRAAPPRPWLEALVDESEGALGAAGPEAVAALTWALATWRHALGPLPQPWLRALWAATAPALPSMPAPALGELAWGIGNLRADPPPAWLDALAAAAAARCGGGDDDDDGGGGSAAGDGSGGGGGGGAEGGRGAGGGGAVGGALGGLQVVNVLWTLARCGRRPDEAAMRSLMRGARASVLAPAGAASPTDLSSLLWSAGRLGYLPDAGWLDAWLTASEAAMRSGRYGPSHYAAAALELGRWGVVPAAAWRAVFFRSSAARLGLFNAQQLGTLLWGLNRMAAPVPYAWLTAAVEAAAEQLPRSASARAADAGRLLGGLARLRPQLPRGAVAGGGGDGSDGDGGAEAGGGSAPPGIVVWAADGGNAAAVRALMARAAPLFDGGGGYELLTAARGAAALRVRPPEGFAAALAAAADAAAARGALRGGELAAVREEVARLAAL